MRCDHLSDYVLTTEGISKVTQMAAPLYALATKGMHFEWMARREEAFEQLKTALKSAPVLGFPRAMQDSEEQVVAQVSKSLEGSEQRYCTARKELLAAVRALKHFKCYLNGQKITVRTDNSAVSWLHQSKDPMGQPARWIEVIDMYNITFQHRPGRNAGMRTRSRACRATNVEGSARRRPLRGSEQ